MTDDGFKNPRPSGRGVVKDQHTSTKRIFEDVTIPIAYKMGYITNSYREPAFRAIESQYGLTRPETLVLIFLAVVDGCTASDICAHSGHLKTNISRAVIALEGKGLIRRRAAEDDLRRLHLYITPEGRDLHGRFIAKLDARERAMMSCLSPDEYAVFEQLLRKVCEHMPNWEDDAPMNERSAPR